MGPIEIVDKSYNITNVITNIINTGSDDAFYICDVNKIVSKYMTWVKLMPRVEPFYAVKCNDSAEVLLPLASLGVGFDCASKGELSKILSIGIHQSRIIFANPTKLVSDLLYAAEHQVKMMTFDGESELYKIKKHFPDAQTVLRIRFDDNDADVCLGEKYGCDPILEAPSLLNLAQVLGIRVIGISFHIGSGSRNPSIFYKAIHATQKLFDYAEVNLGNKMKLLDIGGGYPGDSGTLINEIAGNVNRALDECFADTSVRVIAEPGTFFVASAYTLACNVYATRSIVKNSQLHNMYFINDGVYGSFHGMHKLGDLKIVPKLLKNYSTTQYPSSIWGPTLDSVDVVCPNIMLPQIEIGDWMIFENMGAYTLCTASAFNAVPVPRVYSIVDSSTKKFLQKHCCNIQSML